MGLRSFITGMFSKAPAPVAPAAAPTQAVKPSRRRPTGAQLRSFAILAAMSNGGSPKWAGSGPGDDYNREYLESLEVVQQRSQDLDVNNPDVHGHNRSNTAQVIGRGLRFNSAIRHESIGISAEDCRKLNTEINRRRKLHSKSGGFDASGRGRSEGKLQEQAFLTHKILGSVLIHRVMLNDANRLAPLAVEILPTTRLTTPFDKMGDPTVSYGIQYTDQWRTKVKGYWMRKPARNRGNAFLNVPEWDYIPAEDGVLLSLTEQAGLDRALPAVTCLVKTLRNKGELTESVLGMARTQAKRAIAHHCAEGANPFDTAEDDQQQAGEATDAEPAPVGFVTMGDNEVYYTAHGEEIENLNVNLPAPDFPGFMKVADVRCARGLVTSLTRFSHESQSSYSGGMQEEQHGEPFVDEQREAFENAWQRVHEWFIDSLFLTDFDMPNYSESTRIYYHEAEVTPLTAKLAINPVDAANATWMDFALRTKTPQQACAEKGRDLDTNLEEWARAIQLVREKETEHHLVEGTLDFLLEVPTKQAVTVSSKDGDGDGLIGEGKTEKVAASEKPANTMPFLIPGARPAVINALKNGKNGAAHAH